jgi:type IV secretion system protein VirD4
VLSPSDGTVAPLAVTLMERLIRRQRIKVSQWEEYPRVGMFLDELPTRRCRNILQYFAEARAGSVDLCCGTGKFTTRRRLRRLAGSGDPRCGPSHFDHVRGARRGIDAVGGVLGGQDHRSHHSYDHNLDAATTSRQVGNALEPEELSPPNMDQARLLGARRPRPSVAQRPAQPPTWRDWPAS